MIPVANQKRFEELLEEMKGLFDPNTTSAKITITCEQTRIATNLTHADQLRKRNASMRNIKGEWIN